MRAASILLIAGVVSLTGCRSAYIAVTIQNHTDSPIALLEVDYPTASFGTHDLSPGATFQYRFKVLGSGGTTLLWTDASHRDHKSSGPALKEGDEGTMEIVVSGSGATWTPSLHHR